MARQGVCDWHGSSNNASQRAHAERARANQERFLALHLRCARCLAVIVAADQAAQPAGIRISRRHGSGQRCSRTGAQSSTDAAELLHRKLPHSLRAAWTARPRDGTRLDSACEGRGPGLWRSCRSLGNSRGWPGLPGRGRPCWLVKIVVQGVDFGVQIMHYFIAMVYGFIE